MWGTTEWTKRVNEALKGELKINYVGGPEIIARFEQHEALKNGVLDIGFVVGSDIQDVIPEAQGQVLSKLHPSKERESGFYEYMDKLYQERMNIKVIGRMAMSPFYLWLRSKPGSLADLKGVKMRTAGLYDRLMQNFGMIPVTMNSPELFTALERGVVEGFGWPNTGLIRLGWAKHVKYAIDLPFFEWSNVIATMNLDRWNSLSPAVQKKIMDITIAFEPHMVSREREMNAAERIKVEKAGITFFKFSAAENKEYLEAAYNLEWSALEKRIGADGVVKLRQVSGN